MTVKTQAPWSDATVKALNELQTGKRYGHPYTCDNRGDGNHHHNGNDLGCLDATPSGWICPDCDYTQDWHVGIMPAANAFDELLKR